ncbi:MAG TPA: Fic family protein [Kineosporiaceae bacterium]|nr:Fic family protein [Kineosporiaceae bacterium]
MTLFAGGTLSGNGPAPWPAVATQPREWQWPVSGRKPPRGDRHFREFEAAVPADIAGREVRPGPEAAAALAASAESVAVLDRSTTVDLTALAGALLRSESVASSKIEHLRASQREVGLAMLRGVPVHSAAAHVAANVRAMTTAVDGTRPDLPYTVDDLLAIHRTLLADDPMAAQWAGQLRGEQNWIGGSDHSPRGALFVPPPPGLVGPLMADLAGFCSRSDVDPVAHAAIAHAQFETIHPFADGNGRTGRALVHVLLRRGGLAVRTVVPVSTVLLADVNGYFSGLTDYRAGRLDLWLTRFAAATSLAASAGQRLAAELAELREGWRQVARPRRGSAVAVILERLLQQPVVDIDALRVIAPGVADKNLYRSVDRLTEADVLTELSGAGRNRVWAALDVLDLLEQFEASLGRRRLPAG